MDTTNRFLVGAADAGVRVMLAAQTARMTEEQAINLAAWLVALADPDQKKFQPLLEAILNA